VLLLLLLIVRVVVAAAIVKQVQTELQSNLGLIQKLAKDSSYAAQYQELLDLESFKWAYAAWSAISSVCPLPNDPSQSESCLIAALLTSRYDAPVCCRPCTDYIMLCW
jgi:hypothetical protein